MISKIEMANLLKECDVLNLGSFKAGQADSFWEVINTAMPEVSRGQARRALFFFTDAATTENRGQFLTPGDWLKAIRDLNAGDLEANRERLRREIGANGHFVTEGIEDPAEDVAWRQAATQAFMGGASRSQAEAHAWQSIGQSPPAIEPTTSHHINISQIGRS